MSMPFMWGGVPCSFTVPLIVPPSAALALLPEDKSKTARSDTTVSIPANWYQVFMGTFLLFLFRLGLGSRLSWTDRLQPKLPGNVLLFGMHGLQGSQIKRQVP